MRPIILPASSGVHDGLASLLAKGVLEVFAIMLAEPVTGHGLTAVLVYTLKDLVAGGVAKTGEQREELAAGRCGGCVLEDDLVQFAGIGNLDWEAVSSPKYRRSEGEKKPPVHAGAMERRLTLVWLLISRFAIVST